MRKSLFLSSLLLSMSANAGEYVADVAVGMSSNAVHGVVVNGEESSAVGYYYAVPSLDIGLGRSLNQHLGTQVRLKADMYALQDAEVAQVGVEADYAVSAAVALTYTSGESKFYAGPAVQYVNATFASEEISEQKAFDGFGAVLGVSHRITDYVGVKVSAQHIVNKQIQQWEGELLNEKVGTLKTGVSQLSISLCSDLAYNL